MGLLARLVVVGLLLLGGFDAAAADGRVTPSDTWTELLSEKDSGWSREHLGAADQIAASLGSSAYLVVHHGVIVHRYRDVTRPLNLYSARKSVLSVLYGIYVDRGVIDLLQTLGDLAIDDTGGLGTVEKTATVQQLLQSRSGVYHDAAYETPEAKAARPPRASHLPGEYWYYNNWDFNALGGIFQARTSKSVFEALRDELATPLQFQDFHYPEDTQSVFEPSSIYPAYVMKLSARDFARVGLLMARDGVWQGKPLVSARWVAESTYPYSAAYGGLQGYGYLWWVPQKAWPFWTRSRGDVFFAVGNGGQFLFVDKGRDLVIVHQVRLVASARRVTAEAISPLLARILAAAPAK